MFERLGIGAFKQRMVQPEQALPGRPDPLRIEPIHFVTGRPIVGDFPGMARVQFGMGCFWGAERLFWSIPGVVATAAGYSGGYTPNPTYEEVCSGQTGHAETVLVVYDPAQVPLEALLKVFWENHDPTQGMRQGNDVGTQYRSAIYVDDDAQRAVAEASRAVFQARLREAGYGAITTEIRSGVPFFHAETAHQQYLAKNPNGYCGLGGTGVSCPVGIGVPREEE
ncbi:peptide-methionine (S)-S-oxide reductase MsrA [Coralloluteibacterium thermophilus]|uniref:Peptide methionine sulfoxide reductase MsrA n=1 Tax=Coralloluteibacterium thermophilum TaxID=2707049 RepID=A0ABV9NRW8_9GAMM